MVRLLIADGDGGAREDAAALVRQLLPHATVAEAATWEEALDRALVLRPQGALVALRLGARSGVELAERLREAGLDTACCLMAHTTEPELIRQAMRAGARDWLLTPLDREELRAFFRRVLPPEEPASASPLLQLDWASLSPLTVRVMAMAQEGFRDPPVTLGSIAERLHMNGKYVGRVFLRETGMKLSQYLLICRVEEARRLVVNTREKISVIANTVGYSQLNRFYVHFRSYFGVSPGALRRTGRTETPGEEARP